MLQNVNVDIVNALPRFNRCKFSKYAVAHDKHVWKQKKYLEKNVFTITGAEVMPVNYSTRIFSDIAMSLDLLAKKLDLWTFYSLEKSSLSFNPYNIPLKNIRQVLKKTAVYKLRHPIDVNLTNSLYYNFNTSLDEKILTIISYNLYSSIQTATYLKNTYNKMYTQLQENLS